jgi:hypothetical protein
MSIAIQLEACWASQNSGGDAHPRNHALNGVLRGEVRDIRESLAIENGEVNNALDASLLCKRSSSYRLNA